MSKLKKKKILNLQPQKIVEIKPLYAHNIIILKYDL